MIRPYVRFSILIFIIALSIALVVIGMMVRDRAVGVYTDDDTIRRDASSAVVRDVLWKEAVLLSDLINTELHEYEAKLTVDGSTLFFVRGKASENADLWTCTRNPDGSWASPEPIASLNTDADELGPEPSADGTRLFFYSNRSGGQGGYDLWVAHRNDGQWNTPENLGTRINSAFNDYSPAWLPDGSGLYFATNRPQQNDVAQPDPEAWTATIREDLFRRDYDLYFAPASEHGLGNATPVHELNSASNDGAPAVSPVGDFVYFASDRNGGEGGFDLYRARRTGNGYHEVESLGPAVNSPLDELDPALSMGGFALYFSSNRSLLNPESDARGDSDDHFDLYMTSSREVYLDVETRQSGIGWDDMFPYLLGLLLALLALLLLLALLRLLRSDRYGRLSLLARCVLASMLVHLVVLLLLTLWGVGSSFTDWVKDGEGTQIRITSPSIGHGLASQMRGALVDVAVRPEMPQLDQQEQPVEMALAKAATATFEIDRAALETVRPVREIDAIEDAAPERIVEIVDPIQEPEAAEVSIDVAAPQIAQRFDAREVSASPSLTQPEPVARAARNAVEESSVRTDVTLDVESFEPEQDVESFAVRADRDAESAAPALIADVLPEIATPDTQAFSGPDALLPPDPQPVAERAMEAERTVRAEARELPRVAPLSVDTDSRDEAATVIVAPSMETGRLVEVSSRADGVQRAQDLDSDAPVEVAIPNADSEANAASPMLNLAMAEFAVVETEMPTVEQAAATETMIDVAIDRDSQGDASARAALDTADPPVTDNTLIEVDSHLTEVPFESASLHESSIRDAPTPTDTALDGSTAERMEIEQVDLEVSLRALPVLVDENASAEAELAIDAPELPVDILRAQTDRAASDAMAPRPMVLIEVERPIMLSNIAESMTDRTALLRDASPTTDSPIALEIATPRVREMDALDIALPVDVDSIAQSNDGASPDDTPISVSARDESVARAEWLLSSDASRAENSQQMRPSLALPRSEHAVDDQSMLNTGMRAASALSTELAPERVVATAAPAIQGLVFDALELDLPDDLGPPADAYAQRAPEVRSEVLREMGGDETTEEAVARALAWLARHQSANGRWDSDRFDERTCPDCNSTVDVDIAVTGLALLCFLAADHTPDKDGPYQDTVRNGLGWLLRQQGRDGSLMGMESMYSHGIATIAMAEAFGMTRDERFREPTAQAVDFILRARNRRVGGWRYAPGQVGDTSVLGWQIMALKSAERAGIDVDPSGFREAERWLERVRSPRCLGHFSYQPNRAPSHAMTAEAMFVRQLIGVPPTEPSMQAGARFLLGNPPDWEERPNTYYWYYATLALLQQQGDAWEQWNERIKDVLIANQIVDGEHAGSWETRDKWSLTGGRIYQTAICTLTLEVYYRYLPLYLQDEDVDIPPASGGAE